MVSETVHFKQCYQIGPCKGCATLYFESLILIAEVVGIDHDMKLL